MRLAIDAQDLLANGVRPASEEAGLGGRGVAFDAQYAGDIRPPFFKVRDERVACVVLANRGDWQHPRTERGEVVGSVGAASKLAFAKIDPRLMITPDQAWDWNMFKAQGGPTYAGSAGWKRYTDFLIAKMAELGAVPTGEPAAAVK